MAPTVATEYPSEWGSLVMGFWSYPTPNREKLHKAGTAWLQNAQPPAKSPAQKKLWSSHPKWMLSTMIYTGISKIIPLTIFLLTAILPVPEYGDFILPIRVFAQLWGRMFPQCLENTSTRFYLRKGTLVKEKRTCLLGNAWTASTWWWGKGEPTEKKERERGPQEGFNDHYSFNIITVLKTEIKQINCPNF